MHGARIFVFATLFVIHCNGLNINCSECSPFLNGFLKSPPESHIVSYGREYACISVDSNKTNISVARDALIDCAYHCTQNYYDTSAISSQIISAANDSFGLYGLLGVTLLSTLLLLISTVMPIKNTHINFLVESVYILSSVPLIMIREIYPAGVLISTVSMWYVIYMLHKDDTRRRRVHIRYGDLFYEFSIFMIPLFSASSLNHKSRILGFLSVLIFLMRSWFVRSENTDFMDDIHEKVKETMFESFTIVHSFILIKTLSPFLYEIFWVFELGALIAGTICCLMSLLIFTDYDYIKYRTEDASNIYCLVMAMWAIISCILTMIMGYVLEATYLMDIGMMSLIAFNCKASSVISIRNGIVHGIISFIIMSAALIHSVKYVEDACRI